MHWLLVLPVGITWVHEIWMGLSVLLTLHFTQRKGSDVPLVLLMLVNVVVVAVCVRRKTVRFVKVEGVSRRWSTLWAELTSLCHSEGILLLIRIRRVHANLAVETVTFIAFNHVVCCVWVAEELVAIGRLAWVCLSLNYWLLNRTGESFAVRVRCYPLFDFFSLESFVFK